MKIITKIISVVLLLLMSATVYAKGERMINQLVIFEVKPEYFVEFKAASVRSLRASLEEPGNVEMKLYSDDNVPNKLYVYSRWKDEAGHNAHGDYDYTKELRVLAGKSLQAAPVIMKLGATTPAPDHLSKQVNANDTEETLFFIFKIKPEHRQQVMDRFEIHVESSRQEEGNLWFDLYTVDGDDDTFVVYENWRSKSALWEVHMKQKYAELTGALLGDVSIGNIEDGMNFITEIKE